jgi:uncharacterized protein (DUF169 family)
MKGDIVMMDYSTIELELRKTVGISKRPVAVTFRSSPPRGIPKYAGKAPSGCSFFRIASGGMTFYTVPTDHYNCPLGCYSYNLPLSPGHSAKLKKSLESMQDACSIKLEEVHSVHRTDNNPKVVVYSPLGDTPVGPDVTVLVVNPLQAMFLQEAALRKRIKLQVMPFRLPTCMCLHTVLDDTAVTSAGCMGSRVYNDLGDDEFYMLMPGRLVKKVAEEVQNIATANAKLAEYYLERRNSIETMME